MSGKIAAGKLYGVVRVFVVLLWTAAPLFALDWARNELRVPDLLGYITLRCDFHIHTVFSDGRVWPTVRVDEAWRDGLDVLAITDHIEYLPHKQDIQADHNRAVALAVPDAQEMGLMLLKGTEITKQVPPGHFNALFLQDTNPVENEDYLASVGEAVRQGAFVFWNHPPFKQKDNQSIWHPEHTILLEKGWLHGIEVVNGRDYYPEAQRWCLEKKLTMIGTSDIHSPIDFEYENNPAERRPMTLVFVAERTQEALKAALFDRRTVVYGNGSLYGEARWLEPLFARALANLNPRVAISGRGSANVQLRNLTDIDFQLTADGTLEEVNFPKKIRIPAGKVVLLGLDGKSADLEGKRNIALPYRVDNVNPAPGEGLPVRIEVEVEFRKAK